MMADNVEFPGKHNVDAFDEDDTQKLSALKRTGSIGTLEKNSCAMDSSRASSEEAMAIEEVSPCKTGEADDEQTEMPLDEIIPSPEIAVVKDENDVAKEATGNSIEGEVTSSPPNAIADENNGTASATNAAVDETTGAKTTLKLPILSVADENTPPFVQPPVRQQPVISRGRAILLVALLVIVGLSTINLGSTQFLGPQGWAYVLGGPATNQQ